MSEAKSLNGEFSINIKRHTLESEEIPTVIGELGAILINMAKAYDDLREMDVQSLANDIIRIYESIKKIKEEIED